MKKCLFLDQCRGGSIHIHNEKPIQRSFAFPAFFMIASLLVAIPFCATKRPQPFERQCKNSI